MKHTEYSLPLSQLSAAVLVVSSEDGRLLGGTPDGLVLVGVTPPAPLPSALRLALESVHAGEAAEWRPSGQSDARIACTRYECGPGRYTVWLRENTPKQDLLAQRLHRQRLEITGRLVAMIAHDLRVPLTSIVFNADVAYERQLSQEELTLTLADIRSAAARMRHSIDGLLDFARIGPSKASAVELSNVISRVESLLRPQVRDGSHQLQVTVHPQANWVCGNALVVEQVLANLLMNAMEASRDPVHIRVTSARLEAADAPDEARALRPGEDCVRLVLEDNGPGIVPELRERIFEPFFTTKPEGVGLGLPMAREALASIGAALTLEPSPAGARFVLWFACYTPRSQEPT